MEKPDNISAAVWKKHLDWFNVTGETAKRHVREQAGRRRRNEDATASLDASGAPKEMSERGNHKGGNAGE
ncbi:hypothetical protein [Hydrocarboniclastica marina]|uniref:Uncharacterized protein n=1 Tax=Hydrocarboniclastica marina TaxID=2259620 RepID=A0A4P7XG89_9ALTE|nr:hypothetical protein [Hydrocarboniclastica marina]QCF25182.1 hypothetical protein soil367_04130 [Hydrocarboniclastica marina]